MSVIEDEVTLNIALVFPSTVDAQFVLTSKELAARMTNDGQRSAVILGDRQRAHSTADKLTTRDVPGVCRAVHDVALTHPHIRFEFDEWKYNPHGAPEWFAKPNPTFRALQLDLLAATETYRSRQFPEYDASGLPNAELLRQGAWQLEVFGYDGVDDDGDLGAHVTCAWPDQEPGRYNGYRVDLGNLPTIRSARAIGVGVFLEDDHGTCTHEFARFALEDEATSASAEPVEHEQQR